MSLSPTASFTFNIYPSQMGNIPMASAPNGMQMGNPQMPFAPPMTPGSMMPPMPGPILGGDMFGRVPMGFYPPMSPYAMPSAGMNPMSSFMQNPMMAWSTPFLSPFQQLQDLYFQTMNGWMRARSAWSEAERAKQMAEQEQSAAELLKQNYMTLGQQLEADAKAVEAKPSTPPPAPFNQAINFPPPQAPTIPAPPMPAALPPALATPSPFQLPPAMPPHQNPLPLPPAPMPEQAMMPPLPPPVVSMPQAAPPEMLTQLLAQPTTAQNYDDKQKALQQIASQGPSQMTPPVLDALKSLVLQPMPDEVAAAYGLAKPQADAIRENAIWTLGLVGGSYPKEFDTNALPGLGTLEQVLSNPKESPAIRAAAVQALRAMDRPGDPRISADIAKAEEVAQHDTSAEVRDQVAKAKSGMPLLPPGVAAMPQLG